MSNLARNLVQQQGTSWEALFGIDASGLTNLTRSNFNVFVLGNTQLSAVCICFYTGSGAITISELDDLPVGTVLFATGIATPAIYFHTTASAWKYQAVAT